MRYSTLATPARWFVVVILLSVLAAACGSSEADETAQGDEAEEADQGENLCDLFTDAALLSLDDGMDATLSGATRDSIEQAGATCQIRYSSGDAFIELIAHPEGTIPTDGFLPLGTEITTDGATMSTAQTESGVIIVQASTSDPAGISTWDASLAGAGALLP